MSSVRHLVLIATLALAACGDSGTEPVPPPAPPPPPAPVATVELSPTAFSLSVGESQEMAVTTRSAAGQVLNGRPRAFESTAPGVATVSAAGVVSAVATGEAEIIVTSEGKSAKATVTVQPAAVAAVQIAPMTLTLDLGATEQLTAVTRDALGNILLGRVVTWESTAPAVVSVSEQGLVTGLSAGSAFVTAYSEGKGATATIQVHVPVATIQILGGLDTLEAFDERQLQAALRDANGDLLEPRPISWTVSDPAIATIDASGKLTGLDRGTVTITAEREGKTHSVTRVVVIKYRSITAGTMHACDIASGGIAWCWGLNSTDGRLGLEPTGDGVHRTAPHRVPGNHVFTQLVTYSRTTCGLTTQGKAYCWGTNGWGALGSGADIAFSTTPVAVAGNQVFTQLTAGADHACGTTTLLGPALCWGHNDWGQFGNGLTGNANVPVVAAGGMPLLRIATGTASTCGIAVSGAAFCWGANSIGQTGNGGAIPYGNVYHSTPQLVAGGLMFASISAGNQFACGVSTTGQGYCWGSNNGKLGDGTHTDSSSPKAVAGGHLFRSISTGFGHACGVTTQDALYCWGSNGYGQLGVAGPASSTSPIRSGGSILVSEVSAAGIGTGSGAHTCAISKDRLTTWCFGRNDTGQLGNGQVTAPAIINAAPSIVVGQKPL